MPSRTKNRGGGERREMRACAGTVEHVDGIGEPLEAAGVGQNVGRIHRVRWPHFCRDGELARPQHALQPACALRLVCHDPSNGPVGRHAGDRGATIEGMRGTIQRAVALAQRRR